MRQLVGNKLQAKIWHGQDTLVLLQGCWGGGWRWHRPFELIARKVFQIGTVRYNWPMSAHASQAFSIAHCADSEDLPVATLPCMHSHSPPTYCISSDDIGVCNKFYKRSSNCTQNAFNILTVNQIRCHACSSEPRDLGSGRTHTMPVDQSGLPCRLAVRLYGRSRLS